MGLMRLVTATLWHWVGQRGCGIITTRHTKTHETRHSFRAEAQEYATIQTSWSATFNYPNSLYQQPASMEF